uniref:Thaumatin-like protein n=1 Tax=Brassica campestris TaxID=3711 RepID=A0A3P6BWI0_BRACM|nr:unnamed protein product [Brassica rapa]
MARFSGLHILFFSFIIATGAISVVSGTVFTIVNRCNFPVWPGILTGDNGVQLNGGGFALKTGASVDVAAPAGCTVLRSRRSSTGYTRRIHDRSWRRDGLYDVSLVDDLNKICPTELSVLSGGSVVACKSACEAFGSPQYCCTGAFNKPETCPPTDYSRIFKAACPKAYSYAYDDATSTFTCANANYSIIFCPTI